jgi:Na+/phosphate symporter
LSFKRDNRYIKQTLEFEKLGKTMNTYFKTLYTESLETWNNAMKNGDYELARQAFEEITRLRRYMGIDA